MEAVRSPESVVPTCSPPWCQNHDGWPYTYIANLLVSLYQVVEISYLFDNSLYTRCYQNSKFVKDCRTIIPGLTISQIHSYHCTGYVKFTCITLPYSNLHSWYHYRSTTWSKPPTCSYPVTKYPIYLYHYTRCHQGSNSFPPLYQVFSNYNSQTKLCTVKQGCASQMCNINEL